MEARDFKRWRHAMTWSQQEAADALDMSRASVANYEAGKRSEDGRPVLIPKVVELACNYILLKALADGTYQTTKQFRDRLENTSVLDGLPTEGEADRFRQIEMDEMVNEVYQNLIKG